MFRRSRLPADGWILKKADSKVRRHSMCLQKRNWRLICGSVSSFTSTTNTWRERDSLCSERKPKCPFRCLALAPDRTLPQTAELFTDCFGAAPPAQSHDVVPNTTTDGPVFPDVDSEVGAPDALFTVQELQAVLQKLHKNSVPEPDCDKPGSEKPACGSLGVAARVFQVCFRSGFHAKSQWYERVLWLCRS